MTTSLLVGGTRVIEK